MKRFDYQRMVHNALRHVVRSALEETAEHGLDGDHHFYIMYRTDHPDVEMSPALRARYPETITIILQNQFWGLEVDDHGFSVSLAFDRVPEPLRVPYAAIETFADPSAEFGLQFENEATTNAAGSAQEPGSPGIEAIEEAGIDEAPDSSTSEAATPAPRAPGEVVQIDEFRRK